MWYNVLVKKDTFKERRRGLVVDLYVDDVSLKKIESRHGSQVLIFQHNEKDETLSVPVSNEELLNIYQWVKIRCETLELIRK